MIVADLCRKGGPRLPRANGEARPWADDGNLFASGEQIGAGAHKAELVVEMGGVAPPSGLIIRLLLHRLGPLKVRATGR